MNDWHTIYTELTVARDELRRRWHDGALRADVAAYLGEIPPCLRDEPRAVLWRNIMTPDHELLHFLELADEIGFKPLGIEYIEDRFCTRNADKMTLAKMAVFNKRDCLGEPVMRYRKIIDIKHYDNARFSGIRTLDGSGLVDFHHGLVRKKIGTRLEIRDWSAKLTHYGASARDYYRKMLAHFICHGVLFESFVTDETEAAFERDVVLPAIEHVRKQFGLAPLIVPVVPDVEDRYWWCYPADVFD